MNLFISFQISQLLDLFSAPNARQNLTLKIYNTRAQPLFCQLNLISINLPAFYHEWRSLIGYATHVLFCDR